MDHAALYAVVGVVSTCETIPEAFDALLPVIGTHLGWDVGAGWIVDEHAQILRNVRFWAAPGTCARHFEAATRASQFRAGDGLPGRVWTTATAHVIADVVADPNFPRARAAAHDRLRGGYALPLRVGGEVLGVLEFFSRDGSAARVAAERTMNTIADGLGIVTRRHALALL